MRKFYQLLAVVLLSMGTLLPTVVTYAQEASAEETATTPIVAPVSSEEIKPEEVTPNPTPTSPTPAAPAQEESSQESSSESGSTGLRSASVRLPIMLADFACSHKPTMWWKPSGV